MPAPVRITNLSPWYGGTDPTKNGMGRRVEVIAKNWDRILKQFDKDHNGELSDAERKDWYDEIDNAVRENKAGNKQYGDVGYRWVPYAIYDNPGYPFFIPGVSGHRAPHPPMDTAWKEIVGFDLDVVAWGDGSGVAKSGKELVILGIDNNKLLHIRIFGHSEELVTDTDETKLPPAKARDIEELKRRVAGLLPTRGLTDAEKTPLLQLATSIVNLSQGADTHKAEWTAQKIRDELRLDPTKSAIKPGDVQYLNGGLPRHLVLGGDVVTQYNTRWDFTKDFVKPVKNAAGEVVAHVGGLYAFRLPEDGTPVERAAMRDHATRTHATTLPESGDAGNFILNGLPPTPGRPTPTRASRTTAIRPAWTNDIRRRSSRPTWS